MIDTCNNMDTYSKCCDKWKKLEAKTIMLDNIYMKCKKDKTIAIESRSVAA